MQNCAINQLPRRCMWHQVKAVWRDKISLSCRALHRRQRLSADIAQENCSSQVTSGDSPHSFHAGLPRATGLNHTSSLVQHACASFEWRRRFTGSWIWLRIMTVKQYWNILSYLPHTLDILHLHSRQYANSPSMLSSKCVHTSSDFNCIQRTDSG